MDHSLLFTKLNDVNQIEYDTWNKWGLIPSERPTLVQPAPVYRYVEIPGRDGPLDMTDYLIGRPTYSDRKGTFEFYVDTDFKLDNITNDWVAKRNSLVQFFDGSKMRMRMADEPNIYYIGRFHLREYRPGATYSTISIEYEIEPYRYNVSDGTEAGL